MKVNPPLQLIPDIHRATHRIGISVSKLSVTQGEAHILAHMHGAGDCTIAQLHRALDHRRSTLTIILDRLEERGLAKRTVSAEDRRSFHVSLTAAGKRKAAEVHAHLAGLEQRALQSASPAEVRAVTRVLRLIGER